MMGKASRVAESRARPEPKPLTCTDARADRLARMLALAYFVEREIDVGAIKDYSEAARLLGMSRTRMTQVANLLSVSPRPQEAILAEHVMETERNLRYVVRYIAWEEQERLLVS